MNNQIYTDPVKLTQSIFGKLLITMVMLLLLIIVIFTTIQIQSEKKEYGDACFKTSSLSQ